MKHVDPFGNHLYTDAPEGITQAPYGHHMADDIEEYAGPGEREKPSGLGLLVGVVLFVAMAFASVIYTGYRLVRLAIGLVFP